MSLNTMGKSTPAQDLRYEICLHINAGAIESVTNWQQPQMRDDKTAELWECQIIIYTLCSVCVPLACDTSELGISRFTLCPALFVVTSGNKTHSLHCKHWWPIYALHQTISVWRGGSNSAPPPPPMPCRIHNLHCVCCVPWGRYGAHLHRLAQAPASPRQVTPSGHRIHPAAETDIFHAFARYHQRTYTIEWINQNYMKWVWSNL